MKNFNDLQRLVELMVRHRLPKTVTLFMEIEDYNKMHNFLKNLGSSGVTSAKLPGANPELDCDVLQYNNYTFYIVHY